MDDIESIIDEATPATATATVCMRGDLLGEHDELVDKIDRLPPLTGLSPADDDPRIGMQARLQELRQEMEAHFRTFRFQAIGDKASSDLMAKHPCKPNEQGVVEYDFDPQTYPAALVAASSVEPKMTEPQAIRLFDKMNLAQRNEIYGAAWRANNRQVSIPFSEAASAPAADTE